MNRKLERKICIVGGGPAGATTSLFLSKHKIPHLIVDKSTFPRDKACGESLDGRVLANLNRLSPDYIKELYEQEMVLETWRYSFTIANTYLGIDLPKDNLPRLLVHRSQFDGFLMEKAKQSEFAEVIENEYIKEVIHTDDKVILKSRNLTIEAELGIIATGAFSKISNHNDSKENSYLYERRYYENFEGRKGNEVEFYTFKKPIRGYIYISPSTKGLYNVGFSVYNRKDLKKHGLKMKEVFGMALENYPEIKKKIENANEVAKKGIYMSTKQKKMNVLAGKRLLNIGAAAFSINPVTGAGVGNSMTTARLMADAIKMHLDHENFVKKVIKTYSKTVKKELKPFVHANILLNLVVNYSFFLEPIIPVIAKTKSFKNLVQTSNIVNHLTNVRFHVKNVYRSYITNSK